MIKINIKSEDLLAACKEEQEKAKNALIKAVDSLAKAAETHLIELVKTELNPHHADMFMGGGKEKNNIDLTSLSPTVHVLTIKDTAVEIDDGKELDMKKSSWLFSSSKTKTGAKGKYLVIPFEHSNKAKPSDSDSSKLKAQLTRRVKEEIELQNKVRKAKGHSRISFGGLERYKSDSMGHKKGEIIEGKLHEFDVFGAKKSHWSEHPLTRLGVYQKIQRDAEGNPVKDKKGNIKATRSWMTFRTASEGSPDKFWYPAPKTKDFLERTGQWAEEEFYNKVLPELFRNWGDK